MPERPASSPVHPPAPQPSPALRPTALAAPRPPAAGFARTPFGAAAGAALLAAALAACTGGATAAPGGEARRPGLDATALAALAGDRPATGLRPAEPSAGPALDALLATIPEAAPVGPFDTAQVAGALASAARLVAATRTDPAHLCGPPAASPASALTTPSLKAWLAAPENRPARTEIETTISAAGTTGGCDPLAWVGPRVVLGPQEWTVSPGTAGADLDIAHTGTAGYALTDGQDRPEPWGLEASVTYRLVLDGSGRWLLDGWPAGAIGRVAQGWPHQVPVPDGYLPSPPVPAGDPVALAAVRAAAERWARWPASDLVVEQAQDGLTGRAGAAKARAVTVAAPARGDAVTDTVLDGQTPVRSVHLERGRRVLALNQQDDAPAAWTESDGTAPASFGTSAPTGAFDTVALLADADAAAPADCPPNLPVPPAGACWTAVIATSDPGVPLAATAGLARRSGRPWLVLTVATRQDGLPAAVRLIQDAFGLGEPYARLTSTATFTGYPAGEPPAVPLTDPAEVAPARAARP
jgi:hypothetical protein